MRPIHTLVWHCTATPEGKEFTVQQIHAMHRARGFKGIGYHRVIHLDGSMSEGRPESEVGAHVAGHNVGSIGYSYVGGVDANGKPKDTRTDAQKTTMARLTKEAVERYTLKRIVGHRDLSPDLDGDGEIEPYEWIKVCPCFEATAEYGRFLNNDIALPQKTHVVGKGESVWSIARRYTTTAPVIFAANPLLPPSGLIHPGQKLWIPA